MVYVSHILPPDNMYWFQQKITDMPKKQEKVAWRKKAIIRTRLQYDTDVGIIKENFK